MPNQLDLFDGDVPQGSAMPLPATPTAGVLAAAHGLPDSIRFGTSSWHFPGWTGIVWKNRVAESVLSRAGLTAYAAHPLLRTVCVDRSFHPPLNEREYATYASQVPDGFQFVVKAPMLATAEFVRTDTGEVRGNARFLDAKWTADMFVAPCNAGLGTKVGVMLFHFPPLGKRMASKPGDFALKLAAFLGHLPRTHGVYGIELRDRQLLTRSVLRAIHDAGARYCVGIHPRMPAVAVQAASMAGFGPGPLVIRWNLNAGLGYEEAKVRHAPFDRLVDEDLSTRTSLARLLAAHASGGHETFVIAQNGAEGSAPLTVSKLAEETVLQLRTSHARTPG